MKHLWDSGQTRLAFERLTDFTKTLEGTRNNNVLLAKCYLTLGNWQRELNDTLDDVCINSDIYIIYIYVYHI